VATIASAERETFSNTMKEAIVGRKVAFTTDLWTGGHKQREYITMTAHWIDQNFRMSSHVECTDEFDPAIRKSGVNIKAAVVNSLYANLAAVVNSLCKFGSCGKLVMQIWQLW